MTEICMLRSTTEVDSETGQPLYFSDMDGWVDLISGTIWTREEINEFPYIPVNSKWVKFVETEL